MTIFWATFLKPFIAFVILCAIAPVPYFIRKKMKDGKLKRLLLWEFPK